MNTFIIEKEYSTHWKDLGSILIFIPPDFQFKSSIIITELDNCLIDYISLNKLYNTLNKHDIVFDEDFIKELIKISTEKSIIILSNQNNSNKLIKDMIKKKFEILLEKINIPILACFSLIENRFSKPHTGMFKLLKLYYQQFGYQIHDVKIVSNNGGLIIEKTKKDIIDSKVLFKDTDRAFANNINAEYYSIDEFINSLDVNNKNYNKKVKFTWDNNIIEPSIRNEYLIEIKKRESENIFDEIMKLKKFEIYIIIILGPPRCGKTLLANQIIKQWRTHEFGYNHEIKRISKDIYKSNIAMINIYRKYIEDRISVIIDGSCNTEKERLPYLNYIQDNMALIYVEINIGLNMAKVFNHVCVEMSKNNETVLYKDRDYYIYRSIYKKPVVNNINSFYYVHYPKIEKNDAIEKYRY